MGRSDFDGDGRDDVAVGVAGEGVADLDTAGAANLPTGRRPASPPPAPLGSALA